MTPVSEEKGNNPHSSPKPDKFAFGGGKDGILFTERLQRGPNTDERDEGAEVDSTTGVAEEAVRGRPLLASSKIMFVGRIRSHAAPVVSGTGCDDAASEKIGHEQPKGFVLGQAPLCGEVIMRRLGGFILFCSGDAFKAGADERRNRIGCNEKGK